MGSKPAALVCALACSLTPAVGAVAGGASPPSAPEPTPVSALRVQLTVSPDLTTGTRASLLAEAQAIWRRARVTIHWIAGGADPASARPPLRVLVTSRLVGASSDGHTSWAVGELLRFDNSGAIAVASIDSARRVIEDSGRATADLPQILHEHRLGIVLGRAVAHEIGHFLLATNTHAKRGLMRATFDSREFADPGAEAFRLDAEAEAHLAAAAARVRSVPPMLPVEGFSYPR